MTIFFLATMLLVTSCNKVEHRLCESEIKKSISVLYEKKIIHTSYDTLYIKLENFELREDSLDEIKINGKMVHLNYKKQGVPLINFKQFPSTYNEKQVLIIFNIRRGRGTSYEGVITFQLKGEQFEFISCNYVSSVE